MVYIGYNLIAWATGVTNVTVGDPVGPTANARIAPPFRCFDLPCNTTWASLRRERYCWTDPWCSISSGLWRWVTFAFEGDETMRVGVMGFGMEDMLDNTGNRATLITSSIATTSTKTMIRNVARGGGSW